MGALKQAASLLSAFKIPGAVKVSLECAINT